MFVDFILKYHRILYPHYEFCKIEPILVITPMKAKASYPSWPFSCPEEPMNPIPLAAAILVKAILEWWMEA